MLGLWNNTVTQISKSPWHVCVIVCVQRQGAGLSVLAKGTSLNINILKSNDRKPYKIKRGCQEVQDVRLFSFLSVFSY